MADDYRRLYPAFWTSDLRERLAGDHAAVVVWLHLLASDTSSSIGLYRVRLPRLAADCYLSGPEEARAKIRAVAEASGGSVLWDETSRVVWLRHAARRQHGPITNKGDNRLKGGELVDEVRFASGTPFWPQFWEEYREHLALELFDVAPPFGDGPPPPPEGVPHPLRPGSHTPFGDGPPPPSAQDPHPLPTHTHTHTHDPEREGGGSLSRGRTREVPATLPPVLPPNGKREHPWAGVSTRPTPVGPGAEREWCALGIEAQRAALWHDLPSGCDPAHREHIEQLREACGRALASYRALCEDGEGGALCDHEADPCISRAVLWWVSQGVDVAEAERRVCAVAAWARERLTAPVGRFRVQAWRLPRVLFGDATNVGARATERWNAYVAERGQTVAQADDPDFEAAMVALGEREAAEREGRTEDADRAHEEYVRRLALSEARRGGP